MTWMRNKDDPDQVAMAVRRIRSNIKSAKSGIVSFTKRLRRDEEKLRELLSPDRHPRLRLLQGGKDSDGDDSQ